MVYFYSLNEKVDICENDKKCEENCFTKVVMVY